MANLIEHLARQQLANQLASSLWVKEKVVGRSSESWDVFQHVNRKFAEFVTVRGKV